MQYELPLSPWRPERTEGSLQVLSRLVPITFKLNRRARRYVLRVTRDGAVRVTVPRGGSVADARRFAERNVAWLDRQLLQRALNPPCRRGWFPGTEILFRGRLVRVEPEQVSDALSVRFDSESVPVEDPAADLRSEIELHMRKLAAKELPQRARELASLHDIPVASVIVRNQRSRWGSCSRRGCISLNWRLIQAPDSVRDYIILHELAHFKEMNHSRRFWREVERLCPGYVAAERWLKSHAELLR